MDSTDALRAKHMRTYTVTLGSRDEAETFAKDFHGKQSGENPLHVEVTARQTLEDIFMGYYGEEQKK